MTAAYLRGPPAARRNGGHSSCIGKQSFTSASFAVERAKSTGAWTEHYRCRFCGLWHIGKTAPPTSNKGRVGLIRQEPAP